METKIKAYYTDLLHHLSRLRDVRVVGLLLFLLVVLMMSWSGVKVIDANYRLQKQIAHLEQQNQVHELGNTNLRLGNDYYQTDQYLDIMARQNFGMAAPGETVLSVPKSVALANSVESPKLPEERKTEAKLPFYQRNFQAWMDFLFHRQSVSQD